MKLKYSNSKWEKEKKDAIIYDGINSTLKNIYTLVEAYHTSNSNSFIQVNDKITLFYLLGDEYKTLANYEYLINEDSAKSFEYLSISLRLFCQSYSLFKNGDLILNESVKKTIESDEFLNDIALTAIAVNQYPLVSNYLSGHIIDSLYKGNIGESKRLIEKLNYTKDESNEVYFTDICFLKDIIMALCDGDNTRFTNELVLRIKKYRHNMIGYSTIIDIASIAILKISKRMGYDISIKAIEIPTYFIDIDS